MLCERIWSFLCLLFTVVAATSLFLLATTGKFPQLPAFYYNPPAWTGIKYPTEIVYPKFMIIIAWPLTMLSMIVTSIYIIIASSDYTFFPAAFFLCWIAGVVATTAWTFTFDLQELEKSILTTGIVTFAFCSNLGIACYRSLRSTILAKEDNLAELPEKYRFWYRYLIASSIGIWTTWTVFAFASSVVFRLAYESSFDLSTPVRTGVYSASEASTIGLLMVTFALGLWMFLDMYAIPRYTACVRSIYGFYAFCIGSILYNNCYPQKGFTLNNWISVVLFGCSLALAVRKCMHTTHKKMQ